MPQQQRGTVTDRLADVIQVIQLGRKSGLLTVERGEGATLEEGAITFINGQAVEASAGRRTGQEALTWLKTWRACRFAFTPSAPASSNGSSALRTRQAIPPAFDTDPTLRQYSPAQRQVTGPLPQLNEQNGRGGARAAGTGPLVPGAPFRTRPYEEALRLIDQMSLSRAHRRLLLLVDGTRSFVELVRLMGRSQEEVLQLFQDLERAGLIRF